MPQRVFAPSFFEDPAPRCHDRAVARQFSGGARSSSRSASRSPRRPTWLRSTAAPPWWSS